MENSKQTKQNKKSKSHKRKILTFDHLRIKTFLQQKSPLSGSKTSDRLREKYFLRHKDLMDNIHNMKSSDQSKRLWEKKVKNEQMI